MSDMDLSDERWDEDQFFEMREEVLAQWPTGAEVADHEKGIDFQRSLPPEKILARVL